MNNSEAATFAAFASAPPPAGIVVSITANLSVGTLIFNAGATVPITITSSGPTLQIGSTAGSTDALTLDPAAKDVTINLPTTSRLIVGGNDIKNLNAGSGRILSINAPLSGSTANRQPRKTGSGTLVLGANATVPPPSGNVLAAFQMLDGHLVFDCSGTISGAATTLNFNGGTIGAVGTARMINNNYAITGNMNYNGSEPLSLTGSGSLTADRTISVHSVTAALNIATLAGSGFGLTKDGPGTLRLSAANTYTAFTSIHAGTLNAGDSASLGGTVFVGNGATPGVSAALDLGRPTGGQTVPNTISINPGDGTNRTLSGLNTSGTNTFSGPIQMDGSFGENRSVRVNATSATGTLSFTNVISGPGQHLTKIGPGPVVFSGNNTYSGTTTIEAGTLYLNGNHAGAGTYTVKSGGTLAGIGSTSASVTVENGGTLAPGNSIGDLSVAALNLHAGARYQMEVDASTGSEDADTAIVTSGNVTLGAGGNFPTLEFVFTPAFIESFGTPPAGKTFLIVNNTGSGIVTPGSQFAGAPDDTPVIDGLLHYTIDYNFVGTALNGTASGGNDIAVTFHAVPEPSAALLLAGVVGLLRRRR
ncbi:MAG: autotransporter-associated beta strand repeat-containing protein [Phycisphaerae bacterium]|nr:autotransporter-associated beta strand repeat-containing protein [Phycisphaerae bacterium]MDW8261026.1 autotransporter-associated beta strand repeat-containing protein [Phycisphaerales bacterium]